MWIESSQFIIEKSAKAVGNKETASAGIELLLFDLDMIERTQSGMLFFVAPDEISRAERYRFDRMGRLYLLRRHILRCLLANKLEMHPANIRLEENQLGRLRLTNGPFLFNTSNSGQYYLVAMSDRVQPGVDIEFQRDQQSFTELFNLALSEEERTSCYGSDAGNFLRYWTCKEALLKAHGSGLR